MSRGGARVGSGRKPKAEKDRLVESLDAVINQEEVLKHLAKLVQQGDFRAIKLWLEYRYGKPKEYVDHTHTEEIELPPWVKTLQIEYVDNTTDPPLNSQRDMPKVSSGESVCVCSKTKATLCNFCYTYFLIHKTCARERTHITLKPSGGTQRSLTNTQRSFGTASK